jgi:hypothetical protein
MVSLREAKYMYRRDRLVAERNLLCKSSLIKKMEKKKGRGGGRFQIVGEGEKF